LAVKWGDGRNVGQDLNQRDRETDPSAPCKISLAKQLALSLSFHSPPAVLHTHSHRQTHAGPLSCFTSSSCHFSRTVYARSGNTGSKTQLLDHVITLFRVILLPLTTSGLFMIVTILQLPRNLEPCERFQIARTKILIALYTSPSPTRSVHCVKYQ